jgi:transketolase
MNNMISKNAKLSKKIFTKRVDMVPTRNGYGEGLVEAGKADENVVALCCDLTDSTRTGMFKKEFPERFIEVGVAEQNMAGMAAGMALGAGKIPFISSYAVFSPGLNWSQLRVTAAYSGANVKIMGAHAGISVGPDGATHQALEDIAITRVLPRMTVVVPCDSIETKKAVIALAEKKGTCYMRFAREKTPVMTTDKTPFKLGQAEVFRTGKDVTIVACGPLVYEALLAAEELALRQAQGDSKAVNCEVINSHTIKPLDKKTILESAKKTGRVVTVEEHQITGGLGGAVAEMLAENYPVPMERVGMPDHYGESGQPEELLAKWGMDKEGIIKKVKKVMKRK